MNMLSDKEILEVTSPQERPQGYNIRGPWFVIQKTLVNNTVEAYVLLEWQGEPNTPFVPRIGKRLFTEGGLGEPASRGYPIWEIKLPSTLNELSVHTYLNTIAADFLGDSEDRFSSVCLSTISNLKQKLELACFEQEQILYRCFTIYQRLKKGQRKENEKEARRIDEALERALRVSNGKPDKQKLADFFEDFSRDFFEDLPL
jgi:hypothetical protein